MIRHTSVGVPKGTCYGWTDVPVADTFEQEAAETKRNLESMLDNNKLDIVFSSPLTRARKLAAFCGYDNPVTDDRLKEMNMGDWEMMRYDDIESKDPAILKWYNDYMNLAATNGESYRMLYQRASLMAVFSSVQESMPASSPRMTVSAISLHTAEYK